MKKTSFNILVGLTFILGLVSSCDGSKPKSSRTDTYSTGSIQVAMDESFSPLIEEEIDVYEAMNPAAQITPLYTNELDAINLLKSDSVWVAIAARNYRPDELENLKARRMVPISFPIAYDGLALIVNKENTDTCISVKDFSSILSGKATKWSDIYADSKLGEIDVVFDNKNSSTVHYCVDSILGGKPINCPNISAVKKSEEVINYVEKHKNSIGIIGSNWLNDKRDTTNLTFKKNITVMQVSKLDKATPMNSRKPFQYYFLTGEYPLVRTIYVLLNDPHRGLPTGFGNFISSPRGQMIVLKTGLLPYRGELNIRTVNVSDE
ncbi:MAG: substrate-binding domain-containing protein [Prevotella sp.]|nr:substrate-binding domain-containing protein [Prevotella sp.]